MIAGEQANVDAMYASYMSGGSDCKISADAMGTTYDQPFHCSATTI